MTRRRIPVACDLPEPDSVRQALEWSDLRRYLLRRRPIEAGVELTFPAEVEGVLRDLARREAECCRFLSLTVAQTDRDVRLEITGPPEAAVVIELLAGYPAA